MYSDIPGNCEVDELDRKGTTLQLTTETEKIFMPLVTCKHKHVINDISQNQHLSKYDW